MNSLPYCHCAVLLLSLLPTASVHAKPISFRNEVLAILSRSGCNLGACHGNQNGKNGFKLSLRGEDPELDLASLTRDMSGRRLNIQQPAESLLLLKATATLPHEGGRRFSRGSAEYDVLSRWIAEGAKPDLPDAPVAQRLEVTPLMQVLVEPADRVQLQVRATFSDGTVREVTPLACFEPCDSLVTANPDGLIVKAMSKPGVSETAILVRYLNLQTTVQLAFVPDRALTWQSVPEANYVDRYVFTKLRTLRLQPSQLCSDSTFLRRVYLDTLGLLPTVEEVRNFLADPSADKRSRLIEDLLHRPEFADFWALKWSDLLHNEEKTLDRKGVGIFHRWIRQCIAEGKPLNEFARDILAARGSTYSNPAANFYRALRDPYSRVEAVAQVFFGIRLQCAKCHNHPFDRWTQDDYYSLASFFNRVQYRIVENNRRDKFDHHEFDGEQIVWFARTGEMTHPRTGAPLPPRFLGSPTPDVPPDGIRLEALADWVAHPNNPFFARAQVNRVWMHLLGRGIVEPNDDFRASNPPVNGPLLEALVEDFKAHHFDLRHLVRTILNSRTYQLSSEPNETNREDETNFSRALVRPLQAEQLFDALTQVTGVQVRLDGYPRGTRAVQMAGVQTPRTRERRSQLGEAFLKQFGKPERLLSCECERSDDRTLGQAFQMITGELINQMLTEPGNRLGKLQAAGKSDREIIEDFYLAALCRPPNAQESRAMLDYVAKSKDRRTALEDVLWGLLNSKEFLLRQ